MEKVIVVRRTEIVFSIKLTPGGQMSQINTSNRRTWKRRTQRLDIILIKTPFDVFDHQARLSDLRVPYHAYFDDDAVITCWYPVGRDWKKQIPVLFIIIGEQWVCAIGGASC